MRGDFSTWRFAARDNFNGLLPQQGKLLIDADGIAQTRILNHWQQTAARDWVGPVAAVPADEPTSFQITGAVAQPDGTVTLTVGTGHVWADGLLLDLGQAGATPVQRSATWLQPPIVPTPGSAATAPGAQDVVFLEVWQEAINGYQIPHLLIEPALGGVDTAERLHTAAAFRLARLTAGQTCKSVAGNDSGRGKLTATLLPATVIAGDCPIPVGGGYSGFEHRLYRIEIAEVDSGSPSLFKWSRENGGLTGRGTFTPGPNTISITANLVAITTANQPGFQVEIEVWDSAACHWRVACRGAATLNNGVLTFSGAPSFGAFPPAGDLFFRLWDGVEAISSFPLQASPNHLENGIFLQFDADAPGLYRPRDYWTFRVRAGGIENPQTLIAAKPPEGIVYHRVPLAEITWSAGGTVQYIEDCRATITPLTARRGCCRVQVGDGVTSFGDMTSIQAAIDSLPPEGGEICILAGRYFEAIEIVARTGVSLHGCGHHTRLASPSFGPAQKANSGAVIRVAASRDIEIRSLVVEAADDDIGIDLVVAAAGASTLTVAAAPELARQPNRDIRLAQLLVVASTEPAVLLEQPRHVVLQDSVLALRDGLSRSAAVYISGQEILVCSNWVGPAGAASLPPLVREDLRHLPLAAAAVSSSSGALAPCGIQIGGISRDIYLRYNEIEGGSGNGITLGSFAVLDGNGKSRFRYLGYNPAGTAISPCDPGNLTPPSTVSTGGQTSTVVVNSRLSGIAIENNRIRDMGLCGIGPIGFFDLGKRLEVVSVNGLDIVANEISRCLRRTLKPYSQAEANMLGYGGICLPDVAATIIRDNLILNTGTALVDPVCGIFVLHSAGLEISRNRIQDERDWAKADPQTLSGFRAGISILMAAPQDNPVAASSAWTSSALKAGTVPLYQPGSPALVVQENVVDIPIGLALAVAGLGPFTFRGNHLSTGGARGELLSLARSVLIFNFGTPVESPAPVSYAAEYLAMAEALNAGASLSQAYQTVLGNSATILGAIAPGPVSFIANRCSLRQTYQSRPAVASLLLMTFDDLAFQDNQCWLEAPRLETYSDAVLVGASLRVTGCRFQELFRSVLFSAVAFGLLNITTMNQATHALAAIGPTALTIKSPNIVL